MSHKSLPPLRGRGTACGGKGALSEGRIFIVRDLYEPQAPPPSRCACHLPRGARGRLICRVPQASPAAAGEGDHAQHGGRGALSEGRIFIVRDLYEPQAPPPSRCACHLPRGARGRLICRVPQASPAAAGEVNKRCKLNGFLLPQMMSNGCFSCCFISQEDRCFKAYRE